MKRRIDDGKSEKELQDMLFGSVPLSVTDVSAKPTKIGESCAWFDDDDNEPASVPDSNHLKKLRISENTTKGDLSGRLRERVNYQNKATWATVVDDDGDNDILRMADSLIDSKSDGRWKKYLSSGKIDVERLADVNASQSAQKPVTVTKFSSSSSMALIGTDDKYIRIYGIDGVKNEKLIAVKFQDLTICCADFLKYDGNVDKEVMVTGKRSNIYSYDITSGSVTKIPGLLRCKTKVFDKFTVGQSHVAFLGKNGYTHLMSAKYKSWMFDVKMNCDVTAASFLSDDVLITAGSDSEVCIWDLRMSGRCLRRFTCEDGTPVTSLSAFPLLSNSKDATSNIESTTPISFGIGHESGVADLFKGAINLSSKSINELESTKSIMNLTTAITSIQFHPSGEILAIASREKRDQLKLIHTPSGTVFKNWPTEKTPIQAATAIDFSPNGCYFAIGNRRGKVLLYRLKQFTS